jgi:hypothetical protein
LAQELSQQETLLLQLFLPPTARLAAPFTEPVRATHRTRSRVPPKSSHDDVGSDNSAFRSSLKVTHEPWPILPEE